MALGQAALLDDFCSTSQTAVSAAADGAIQAVPKPALLYNKAIGARRRFHSTRSLHTASRPPRRHSAGTNAHCIPRDPPAGVEPASKTRHLLGNGAAAPPDNDIAPEKLTPLAFRDMDGVD